MNFKTIFEKTYTNRFYRIAVHVLFWLLMLGSYYYFNTISFNPTKGTSATYLLAFKNAVGFAAAFYVLMYFIWPSYFLKSKWIKGLLASLLLVVVFTVGDVWADRQIFTQCKKCNEQLAAYHPDYHAFLQGNFWSIVFVRIVTGGLIYHLIIQLSFPVAIKIGRSYFIQTLQQLQLSKDNLQLEFNFLKAQVNPHFLFNTLNNIYSLVLSEKNEKAAATVAQLSGLMRYTLYETGDERILLSKEVQLLKDYVQLEKLRLNETIVDFNFESDEETYTIPPLLFMPALENAFKYCSDDSGSFIKIDIKAYNHQLKVKIENKIKEQQVKKVGGIGLQNMQKRLEHYYNEKYSYNAAVNNKVYLFELNCHLQ